MFDQETINLYWARTEQAVATFEALKEIGYLDAPASKGHHLAVAGGLAEHSVHVTNILLETRAVPDVSAYRIGACATRPSGMASTNTRSRRIRDTASRAR